MQWLRATEGAVHDLTRSGSQQMPWPQSSQEREFMNKLLAACLIVIFGSVAIQTSAQEKQVLRLVQTIPLPGVTGRLDHMGVDLEQKRLFVATVTNNTLEVVDLTGGKVIKSLTGFKDTQDALFLGGD